MNRLPFLCLILAAHSLVACSKTENAISETALERVAKNCNAFAMASFGAQLDFKSTPEQQKDRIHYFSPIYLSLFMCLNNYTAPNYPNIYEASNMHLTLLTFGYTRKPINILSLTKPSGAYQ